MGISLGQVLYIDPATQRLALLSDAQIQQRFRHSAPAKICKAVQALRAPSQSLVFQLFQTLLSLPSPIPINTDFSAAPLLLLSNLLVADVPAVSLTTAVARRFLDAQAGVSSSLD